MIAKIAWRNIRFRPLSSLLSILLVAFSVGIISLLLLLEDQLENKFQRDLQGIDMVVGAKGSPLQLVLSAVYHIDAPTGNIPVKDISRLMKYPGTEYAIPMTYGDTYQSFRILGTTARYIDLYEAAIDQGATFSENMEATLGAGVAAATGLKIGDRFYGSHGEIEGNEHEEYAYQVVGILKRSGSVLDNLILTNVASTWQVHSAHGTSMDAPASDAASDDHTDHDHADHDHEGHDHDHAAHEAEPVPQFEADSMEYTAVLFKFRNRNVVMQMPRNLNEQTNMLATLPAFEINRFFEQLGFGVATIQLIAGGIMLMSGLSVLFILFNRLRDRLHELALLRAAGYRPGQLFLLLLLEGFFLAMIGFMIGMLLSRVALFILNGSAAGKFHLRFEYDLIFSECWLLLATLAVGLIGALLPALRGMRVEVARELGR